VSWAGLKHNTFFQTYRAPFGAVPTNNEKIRIRFRTCANDVNSVKIRIWDDFKDQEIWTEMYPVKTSLVKNLGEVLYWETYIQTPKYPTILYYTFAIQDGNDTDFYVDDDIKFLSGGIGTPSNSRQNMRGFQITVYDKDFFVPNWLKGAFIYQIFPDRFRNGSSDNDPVTGGDWIYGLTAKKKDWKEPICDPRGILPNACINEYHNIFYGGDLDGITQKLNYLKTLGVNAIYLNPIFESPSNHLYDTTNYKKIDPYFGTMENFTFLVKEASNLKIKIILDGVFNHTSADHPFFDYYSRWNKKNQLTSPQGPGTIDDGSGACESAASQTRNWFFIPHFASRAMDDGTPATCPKMGVNEPNETTSTYEAWFSYFSIPKINTFNPEVRNYFYKNKNSVAPFWIKMGASGWRLDVAGDIDSGLTNNPANTFWEEFRASTRRINPNTVVIGEEWGDASPWLLGNEWDSTMNYRFRSALLDWLFDSCSGAGCYSGRVFEDNDSNSHTFSGGINAISETTLNHRLKSIEEDYPPQAWYAMMNLLGSHDTNRILFLLKKISNENTRIAKQKLLLLTTFQFTYPGSPTIYYGDEVGINTNGVWDGATWQDDPYNRTPYPWQDMGQRSDHDIIKHVRKLAWLRSHYSVLRSGNYKTILTDNIDRIFAYSRFTNNDLAIIALNRSHTPKTKSIDLENIPDGTIFMEALSGKNYSVNNDIITLTLSGLGFAILIRH